MVLGVSRCKIAFVVLICAGVLAGCGGGEEQTGDLDQIVGLESDTEDLEARIAELEEEVIEKDRQLAEIAEAAEELEANSTALTDAVAGVANASRSLSFEDWQFAVPRVMDKVKIVATAAADVETATQKVGTVRISVCGRAVDHQAAMALMKRSPKITANCAFAMVHSRGGIFHSFSDRFKIR